MRTDWFTPPQLARQLAEMTLAAAPRAQAFLDPACGDGTLLAAIRGQRPDARLHGIDIDPDAAKSAAIRLPGAHIVCGDALGADWQAIAPGAVVVANPPFRGAARQNASEKAAVRACTGSGGLDLAAAFAAKTGDAPAAMIVPAGLVRGSQAAFWADRISFAVRPQAWPGFLDVSVAIAATGFPGPKTLVWEDGHATHPESIDGHLLPLPPGCPRKPARCGPPARYGNQTGCGGHWLFTPAQHGEFSAAEPQARFTRFADADTMLAANPAAGGHVDGSRFRWLLLAWETPGLPHVAERIQAAAAHRAQSASPRARARGPRGMGCAFTPSGPWLAVPAVSSENRPWMPVAFMDPGVRPSGKVVAVVDAGWDAFGLLSSTLLRSWLLAFGGGLENRIGFGPSIWASFPWPAHGLGPVAAAGQAVAQARDPHVPLGEQYLRPHPALAKAHAALDAAVAGAYSLPGGMDGLEAACWLAGRE